MTRVAIVAGEASGDMHAAALLEELLRMRPGVECFGLGGAHMERLGVRLLYHVRDLAVVGFWELAGKALFFRRVYHDVKQAILHKRPNLLLLVDYPGFNLRLASWAKREGFPVFYYVAPQVWAWGAKRLGGMATAVDRLAVILPFEAELFRKAGIDAHYVGHPLMDGLQLSGSGTEFRGSLGLVPTDVVLGILPGSRRSEIERLLPVMARSWAILRERFPALRPVVAAAPSLDRALVEGSWPLAERPTVVEGRTLELLAASRAALVASGTATLEAACMGAPMVVLYKVSPLSALLVRRMLRIPQVALANIVAGHEVVPELLQNKAVPRAVARAMAPLVEDGPERGKVLNELARVQSLLGPPGASRRAAALAAEMLP